MADTTVQDAENEYPNCGLTNTQKQHHVQRANRFVDNNFGGKIRTIGEVEGNVKDLKTLIAAAYWVEAEGGEVNSQSQTGGSISYGVQNDLAEFGLPNNRYAQQALGYLRQGARVSVEIARNY